MLIGRIFKVPESGAPAWAAEVESIGAWTQGRTREDAIAMLRDWVRTKLEVELDHPGVDVQITVIGSEGSGGGAFAALVEADEPTLLGALLLKYQRQVHGLTVADVARKLGATHHNAYASYEQGRREPSLGKFCQMLAAVAPDMALTIGPRQPALRVPPKAATPRRASHHRHK